MPKARLGVALLLPQPVAAEVDGLRRALDDPALGRIPPHLTLVPPVNVRGDRMPDALARIREVAASARPFTLELGPPASFLPDNPVLYLHVDGDVDDLHRLRDGVFRDPLERTLTWPFVPHVTVADDASPERIEAALTAMAAYRVTVRFERVHLLQEGDGRRWTPIADAAFEQPAVVGRGSLPLELSVTDRLDPEASSLLTSPDRGRPLVLTGRRQGQVVGVAGGWTSGEESVLERIVVDPGARGEGIGSHLLAAFRSEAAARGATTFIGPDHGFLRERGWGTAQRP